jgi:hypothetical protein
MVAREDAPETGQFEVAGHRGTRKVIFVTEAMICPRYDAVFIGGVAIRCVE